jgi:transposase-like protein
MPQPLLQSPTLSPSGAVVGRPRKKPPPDTAQCIEQLAAEGRSIIGVAKELGTSKDTLRRWMTDRPELTEAFERGKEQERHELHELIRRDAQNGAKPNINAMFLLKCRHGYREGDQGEQGSRLNIVFNLPGAMSRENFMKTVTLSEPSKK